MGDEHGGHGVLVVQATEPAPEVLAHVGVEGSEGLVEQQHGRLDGEGAGERHPLSLATRQLPRVAVGQPGELHHLEQLGDPSPGSRASAVAAPRVRTRRCGPP